MSKIFYRDGLEEKITGEIKVHRRSDGFVIEEYQLLSGEKRFFAIKPGTHLCAHGSTIAEAISDALWKDENNRPSLEKLRDEIIEAGHDRKITLNEFRVLTGACQEGCRAAIKAAKHDGSALTAFEIKNKISVEWGDKLLDILGWQQ